MSKRGLALVFCAALALAGCLSSVRDEQGGRGVLCLTFDDRDFDGWTNAIPLFAKYGAHATFFACGELGTNQLAAIQALRAAGHAVGLHSVRHANAPDVFSNCCASTYMREQVRPQLKACETVGFRPRFFAYPNNRHTPETDAYLSGVFTRFRAGAAIGWRDGYYSATRPKGIAAYDQAFFPVADLPKHRVMGGVGVGEYYFTDIDDICAGIRRAAERDEVFTIFSHAIRPDAKGVSMKTAWLERILAAARAEGVSVRSFDELGPVDPQPPAGPLDVVLTFDDGLKSHLTLAAPELEKRGWRGVFCVVTDKVGRDESLLSWDDVRELVRRGHVIATHTLSHAGLGSLCRRGRHDRVRREIRESCDAIERETGVRPKLLCLPGTNCHPDVLKIAREEGVTTMTLPRSGFGAWGHRAKDVIPDLRGRGVTRCDFMMHGITPETGGWKPFPDVGKFIEFLDDVQAAEKAGDVRVGMAGYPRQP